MKVDDLATAAEMVGPENFLLERWAAERARIMAALVSGALAGGAWESEHSEITSSLHHVDEHLDYFANLASDIQKHAYKSAKEDIDAS